MRVLIVCSVHKETGNATAGELHWLLNRLQPDVLFLECSPTDFPAFLDGSYGTLESAVVEHYPRRHEVMLVPVDLHLPNAKFLKPMVDEIFNRVEAESPRYRQLVSVNDQHTEEGGFAYLNSQFHAQVMSEIQKEMRATVQTAGDSKLTELYAVWMRTNDLRELEMINRINAFARHTSFKKGLLLIGAAHRLSLFEKLKLDGRNDASLIVWDFDWHLEEAISDSGSGPDGDPVT